MEESSVEQPTEINNAQPIEPESVEHSQLQGHPEKDDPPLDIPQMCM